MHAHQLQQAAPHAHVHSEKLGAATAAWQKVADADVYLDPLALLYETYVRGAHSRHARYMCTLPGPGAFDLPVHYRRALLVACHWCGGGGAFA